MGESEIFMAGELGKRNPFAKIQKPGIFGSLGLLIVGIIILGLLILPFLGEFSLGEKCVGVVPVSGEILAQGMEPSLFFSGYPGSMEIAGRIKQADADPGVGAIMVEIDSPGGSPVGSAEIYREVRDAKKPVVAYFREIAASGGYYVGVGADRIVSEPDAITGSIGARMTVIELRGLFSKLGINETVFASGPNKAIGDPGQELTPEQKQIIQGMVDEMFGEFKSVVLRERAGKISGNPDQLFDGRIMTGRQAYSAGLVDELGGREDALLAAGKLGGISGKPSECIITEARGGLFGSSLDAKNAVGEFLRGALLGDFENGKPRLD